jgi:putative ATPase
MDKPLPAIIRPTTLDEIVGQQHILGKNGSLRKIIESDNLKSMVLYGPAGTGKTTIARVISKVTNSIFVELNATSAKVTDIRNEGKKAANHKKLTDGSTVVFIDEVARLTKTQSDVLLPYLEDGVFIFIGATTENPYCSLTSALVSRSFVYQLEPLNPKDLAQLILRAVKYYRDNGKDVRIDKEAVKHFIVVAGGDGRKVLSSVELAVAIDNNITLDLAKAVTPSKYMCLSEDRKYDWLSALQGAIQASDADAAVYWLAQALEAGLDPRILARRIMVSASEDASGNPMAAMLAHSAYVSACEIGRPECDIILSHAVVTIATSVRDKSAAEAIWGAVSDVRNGYHLEVPKEMKDTHYLGAKQLGHGAFKDGANQLAYVGVDKKYYFPKT